MLFAGTGTESCATYSGSLISATALTPVFVGNPLSVTVVVQNTGSSPWDNFEVNWITCALSFSWSTPVSSIELPNALGSYSFTIAAYASANGNDDGRFIKMSNIRTVTFTIIEPPPRLSNPTRTNNTFRVAVSTQIGKSYALQFKNSLDTPDWTSLPPVSGDGSAIILIDSAVTDTNRFYRVIRQ